MDNFTIYKRTLGFSIRRIFWDLFSMIVLLAFPVLGFLIASKASEDGALIGLLLGIILGIIVWSMIHSSLIRPFVLTGVLRNYLESGMNNIPAESSFGQLDTYSPKFRKLHSEL